MVVLPMLTTSSMGIVLLQLKGQFVTQVPLLNFQTFASDKVKDLVEVSEVNTRRWKFHTCDVSTLACEDDIETWASWLIHRDLRAIDNEIELHNAFHTARIVQDVSFQDALRDAFLARLREGQHSGSLNVDLLQLNEFMICWEFPETSACIIDVSGDLLYNLILHHDAKAATVGGPFGMNDEGTSASRSPIWPLHISLGRRVNEGILFNYQTTSSAGNITLTTKRTSLATEHTVCLELPDMATPSGLLQHSSLFFDRFAFVQLLTVS
jgi:hypothetical protein